MSDTSKATPRPWKIDYDNDTGPDDDYYAQWFTVGPAKIEFQPREQVYAEANAALIVQAVNSWDSPVLLAKRLQELTGSAVRLEPAFDAMRAVCKEVTAIEKVYRIFPDKIPTDVLGTFLALGDMARHALALAEGKGTE